MNDTLISSCITITSLLLDQFWYHFIEVLIVPLTFLASTVIQNKLLLNTIYQLLLAPWHDLASYKFFQFMPQIFNQIHVHSFWRSFPSVNRIGCKKAAHDVSLELLSCMKRQLLGKYIDMKRSRFDYKSNEALLCKTLGALTCRLQPVHGIVRCSSVMGLCSSHSQGTVSIKHQTFGVTTKMHKIVQFQAMT